MLHRRTAILACILVGVALQIGIVEATGRREPWDSPLYWQVGMPLVALAAACVGYLAMGTAWRAAALIMPAQVATMMFRAGEVGNLWPLALALALVMSLPFVLVAYLASTFRPARR